MSNTTTADAGQEGEEELKHTLSSYLAYGASNGPQDEPPLAWQRKDQSKLPIRLGMRDVAPKIGLMASHENNAHASALRNSLILCSEPLRPRLASSMQNAPI